MSPPAWLATWEPGDSIPDGVTKADLQAVNRALDAEMAGAEPEVIARAVAELVMSLDALGIRIGADLDHDGRRMAKRKLAELYTDAVKALPADLVPVACWRVLHSNRIGARPPTPAQVVATVAAEMHERSRMRAMAFLASREAPDSPPAKFTPEQRAQNLRMISQALARATERSIEDPATAAERMERFVRD